MTEQQLVTAQARARGAVLRILRNKSEDEADDILQQAALNALRFKGDFRGDSEFTTYFYRIAVNQALMLLRSRKQELEFKDLDARDGNDMLIWEPATHEPSPEQRAMLGEVKNRILRTVRRMSLVVLKGFLGLVHGEVADTNTKKAHRHRARVILRHALRGLRD